MRHKPTVLIVEDEKNTREGLQHALEQDYQVLLADNGQTALLRLEEHENVDVLISDLRMPGMDGLTLIKKTLAHENHPVCILLTAYGSIETAVEAMKSGAYDFLTKPINLDQLELLVERALRSRQLESENRQLRRQLDKKFGLENIIGNSPCMEELFDLIRQVAPSRATVLIQGASGTGKELVAQAIHRLSPRAQAPFVAVHCAALPRDLLESELFGHEKGAFTGAVERRRGRFEVADGGTLFLDEISEIDPAIQVKLLRVLEERAFERVGGQDTRQTDIRLVAATNRDLSALVDANRFRQDLFFRLNVVTINLPPLRERANDIPLLLRHFMREFSEENGKQVDEITPEALNALLAYEWPGNVRELRNAVERMVVLTRSNKLGVRDLPPAVRGNQALPAAGVNASSIQEANRRMILAVLEAHGGNRSRAAEQLGISRRTLHRKLNEFGVSGPRARPEQTP
ncbi:MAG: sigma-54-dependent transcriptional regulator [Kiritimatiellia bacterium]|nr:sigma-54 dependent transcriptional regulator [Lentisphaerota bacterium]